MKKGAVVKLSAGDSKAGYWPVLESVRGPGCNLEENGKDQTCTITVVGDVEYTAKYYGGESPGKLHFTYPECPTQRGNNPPAWMSRCQ